MGCGTRVTPAPWPQMIGREQTLTRLSQSGSLSGGSEFSEGQSSQSRPQQGRDDGNAGAEAAMGAACEHIQPHTPGSHKHSLQRMTEEADVERGAGDEG